MNYHLKNRTQKRSYKTRAISIVVGFIILIIILALFNPQTFGAITHAIARPFWIAERVVGSPLSRSIDYFKFKGVLIRENNFLKALSIETRNKQLITGLVMAENEEIKNALGRTEKRNFIHASVLQGPGFSPYDTFVIDAGGEQNIEVGNRVIVDGTLAIGYVKNVYENTSLAVLYSSPGEQVNVQIASSTGIIKAEGRGNGNFQLQLPQDVLVEKGAYVVLPGSVHQIIGIVEEIEKDVTQSFETVLFRYPINIHRINWVLIEK